MQRNELRWWAVLATAALALSASGAFAGFSGNGSVEAMKAGTFRTRNFPGTQAGVDSAVVFADSNGVVQIGPGLEGIRPSGTIPPGVTVVKADSSGWSVLSGGLYLGSAVKNGNGTTFPLLYSDKTVRLNTVGNNYATKSADIVTRFSDSTAATGLSLNGIHSIVQYGVSGVGGGDVQTGMGVGAYSEHRGNSVITGALYGAENATTMYSGGSIVTGFGSLNTTQITTGANAKITTAIGSRGIARFYGGAGQITTAYGVSGIAGTENSSTGTITDAIGARFEVEKSGGTITNATGLVVPAISQGGTNNFGVRVSGRASGGSGINQSLRVDAGDSYFGGKVFPDSGLWCSSGHNMDFYKSDGTLVIRLQGVDGGLNVTGGAKYMLAGFPFQYKSGGTVRVLASAAGDSTQGIAFRDSSDANNLLLIRSGGSLVLKPFTFAGKPSAPTAGMMVFCSDCTRPSDPATGGGTGGMAIYANNRWYVP